MTANPPGAPASPNQAKNHDHLHCSFCGNCQHQVRQLIAGPDKLFICNECVVLCVDIIEQQSKDHGRPAFRHCLVRADEPRYDVLKSRSEEQLKLLEAAEPVIPKQYTALRESIAALLRPSPQQPSAVGKEPPPDNGTSSSNPRSRKRSKA